MLKKRKKWFKIKEVIKLEVVTPHPKLRYSKNINIRVDVLHICRKISVTANFFYFLDFIHFFLLKLTFSTKWFILYFVNRKDSSLTFISALTFVLSRCSLIFQISKLCSINRVWYNSRKKSKDFLLFFDWKKSPYSVKRLSNDC